MRGLAGFLVLLCAAFAASTVVPGLRPGSGPSAAWDVWVYDAISIGTVLLCLSRAVMVRRERAAWVLLAGSVAASAAGDVLWSVVVATRDPVPFPSIADAGWLAFYPLAYAGLVMLVRDRIEEFHLSMWLDGLVAGLAAAAMVAALAFDTIVAGTGGDPATVATTLAYPLGDLLLMVFVVGVFGLTGWRPGRAWTLLGAGLLAWGLADTLYLYQTALGTYVEGRPLDVLWPLGMLLIACAAWQPPPTTTVRLNDWAALLVPSVATVASGAVLVISALGNDRDAAVLLAGGAVLCGVWRTFLTFREVQLLAVTRHQAMTDELTGLANRRALQKRIDADVAAGRPLALIVFDLDGFKELNDAFGHPTGDVLLQRIGPRLDGALRAADLLARLGGDEFAVALPGVEDPALAREVAQRLRAALERPFDLDEAPAHVDASFGIALHPAQARDATELLQRADVAMYHAKRDRTAVEVYRAERDGSSRDRLALVAELRGALERGELVLHYQPQVDAATGSLVAVEGLVRWLHPGRGVLSPDAFIPAIEQTHLMRPLTDHLIASALAAHAAWAAEGVHVPVAINLAPANLLDAELPRRVRLALEEAGAEPSALRLEITETAVMVDLTRATVVLGELRETGVGLSLDDFGVGHSSLAILKHLPIDELKLDRTFARGMVDDPRDAAIITAGLQLGRTFGLSVVVEGVETQATYDALRTAGAARLQGFLIAKPMPASALVPWVRAGCSRAFASAPARASSAASAGR